MNGRKRRSILLDDNDPALFPKLMDEQMDLLARHGKVRPAQSGEVLFREGDATYVMEIGSRRILHQHVTAHPTAAWTLQQFREALPGDHPCRFLIHEPDRIFAEEVDIGPAKLSMRVLRRPVRAPKDGRRVADACLAKDALNDPVGPCGLRWPAELI